MWPRSASKPSSRAQERVDLVQGAAAIPVEQPAADDPATGTATPGGNEILVIEDEPDLSVLLKLHLESEGYRVRVAPDGPAALELLARRIAQPEIVLADYNLPNGMDGIAIVAQIRRLLKRDTPAIILTGDMSVSTLREFNLPNCLRLNKPVKAADLGKAVRELLTAAPAGPSGR